jgi:hypothetical protein
MPRPLLSRASLARPVPGPLLRCGGASLANEEETPLNGGPPSGAVLIRQKHPELPGSPGRMGAPGRDNGRTNQLTHRLWVMMRSAGTLLQTVTTMIQIPRDPLIPGLATNPELATHGRHRPFMRKVIHNKPHSFFHGTRLFPGHRLSSILPIPYLTCYPCRRSNALPMSPVYTGEETHLKGGPPSRGFGAGVSTYVRGHGRAGVSTYVS